LIPCPLPVERVEGSLVTGTVPGTIIETLSILGSVLAHTAGRDRTPPTHKKKESILECKGGEKRIASIRKNQSGGGRQKKGRSREEPAKLGLTVRKWASGKNELLHKNERKNLTKTKWEGGNKGVRL